jgi:transposase-like protein
MAKQHREIVRYSISFKQKVVNEVEGGLGIEEARRRYAIQGSHTIQGWLKKFGKNNLLNKIVRVEMKGERDRIKDLEAEVKKLKIALADATLAKDALETLVDIVNEHYHTDVKKNLGQQSSEEQRNKKNTR